MKTRAKTFIDIFLDKTKKYLLCLPKKIYQKAYNSCLIKDHKLTHYTLTWQQKLIRLLKCACHNSTVRSDFHSVLDILTSDYHKERTGRKLKCGVHEHVSDWCFSNRKRVSRVMRVVYLFNSTNSTKGNRLLPGCLARCPRCRYCDVRWTVKHTRDISSWAKITKSVN